MNPALLQSVRIAVVEDEDGLRELLVDDLRGRGHAVEGLASAEALYRHLSVHPIDIVILDIGLPGEDGFGVASHLRQLVAVGIILLTARTGAKSMQRGFLEGADIYLTKPVDYDVLEAAAVNLYRRLSSSAAAEAPVSKTTAITCPPSMPWALADGGWTLRSPGGASLSLSDPERALLSLLFRTLGETVPRSKLVAALTDAPLEFDPHRLDALVYRLRSRVRETCGEPLPIRSVRGTGYVLASPCTK